MAVLRPPRGLIIDLITPLTRDGKIDGRFLGKHLDRIIPHVNALFLSSPYMGEGLVLKPEQREDLFEKSLVVIRGLIPVFMWITGDTIEKTRELLISLKKKMALRSYTGRGNL